MSMDKDIIEIKKRAGIITEQGQTFTLANQEQIDDLVKAESEWLQKVAVYLNRMGSHDIKANLLPEIRNRINSLGGYQKKTERENKRAMAAGEYDRTGKQQPEGSSTGQKFSGKA